MLGAGLMVQSLRGVDGAQRGVNPKETHAVGVYGAVKSIGKLVMLISVWGQNLDHLCVGRYIFWNSDLIDWLGKDGVVVIVVQNSNVNLSDKKVKNNITDWNVHKKFETISRNVTFTFSQTYYNSLWPTESTTDELCVNWTKETYIST